MIAEKLTSWRIYESGGNYRIGQLKRLLWFKYVEWYYTNRIETRRPDDSSLGTSAHYDSPVIFETPSIDYAKREQAMLNGLKEHKRPRGDWKRMNG